MLTLSARVALPELRQLDVGNTCLSQDFLSTLCRCHLPKLKALPLGHSSASKKEAAALLSNRLAAQLERLTTRQVVLAWKQPGAEACQSFAPFLRTEDTEDFPELAFHTSLTHLELPGTRLRQRDMERLCASDLPFLKRLYVRLFHVQDASPLGWLSLPSLESLRLLSDQMGKGVLGALAHASLPALRDLTLEPCDWHGRVTVRGLSACDNLCSLERLTLRSLCQNDKSDRELAQCSFPRLGYLEIPSNGDLSTIARWEFPALRELHITGRSCTSRHQLVRSSTPPCRFPFRTLQDICFSGTFSFPMEQWLAADPPAELAKVSCMARKSERLRALASLSGLRELHVGDVTEETVGALDGIALRTLEHLEVCSNFLDVADGLSAIVRKAPRLALYCGGLIFKRDEHPQPGLRGLRMPGSALGTEGMRSLCSHDLSRLRWLQASDSGIGVRLLRKCDLSELRTLRAREKRIDADAMHELAGMALPSLTFLDLSDNPLGARGLRELGRCTMPSLERLRLSGREWPTPEHPTMTPQEEILSAIEGWCFPRLRELSLLYLGLRWEEVAPVAARKFPRLTHLHV